MVAAEAELPARLSIEALVGEDDRLGVSVEGVEINPLTLAGPFAAVPHRWNDQQIEPDYVAMREDGTTPTIDRDGTAAPAERHLPRHQADSPGCIGLAATAR